jgi:FlgD Ig-like domain
MRFARDAVSIRHLVAPVLVAVGLGACGRDGPTAPGRYALSGPVILRGFLVDADSRFAGTRVVGDADGVAVELTDGARVLARTTTVGGTYRFTGVGPGAYTVRARVNDAVAYETRTLTVSRNDLAVLDTVRLTSAGDLYPVPNPIDQGAVVYFTMDAFIPVTLEVRDPSGELVRTLDFQGVSPGLFETLWNGLDNAGQPATGPLYWLTYSGPDGDRAQLLFR